MTNEFEVDLKVKASSSKKSKSKRSMLDHKLILLLILSVGVGIMMLAGHSSGLNINVYILLSTLLRSFQEQDKQPGLKQPEPTVVAGTPPLDKFTGGKVLLVTAAYTDENPIKNLAANIENINSILNNIEKDKEEDKKHLLALSALLQNELGARLEKQEKDNQDQWKDYFRENLGNAKMGQLQGPETQLPQGFSISPDSLERISQVFLRQSVTTWAKSAVPDFSGKLLASNDIIRLTPELFDRVKQDQQSKSLEDTGKLDYDILATTAMRNYISPFLHGVYSDPLAAPDKCLRLTSTDITTWDLLSVKQLVRDAEKREQAKGYANAAFLFNEAHALIEEARASIDEKHAIQNGTYLPKCQGTETSCQDLLLSVTSLISIWS